MPGRLVREKVEVRVTATTVEVFHQGLRIAAHVRSRIPHQQTTVAAHMPLAHQRTQEWTTSRFIEWAAKTGPATAQVVDILLTSRAHPEQSYRSCLGILRLGRHYSPARLEAAAHRALQFKSCSFKAIRSILVKGLDRLASHDTVTPPVPPEHENLRGETYYHSGERRWD